MSSSQLAQWITKNPNKHHLPSFPQKKTNDDPTLEVASWDRFTKQKLELPGSLSAILTATDPVYRSSSENGKSQLLREMILTVEERINNELVGRKWSRRKLQELVSAELAEKVPTPSPILDEALCELFQIQRVLINQRDKRITFSPPDVRCWKSGLPLLVTDSENLWLFESTEGTFGLGLPLVQWLQGKEDEQWTIQWSVADGKLEELKAALDSLQLTARAKLPGEKVKKEDYARILGRSQCLSALGKLSANSSL
jgi:hypothetical protein